MNHFMVWIMLIWWRFYYEKPTGFQSMRINKWVTCLKMGWISWKHSSHYGHRWGTFYGLNLWHGMGVQDFQTPFWSTRQSLNGRPIPLRPGCPLFILVAVLEHLKFLFELCIHSIPNRDVRLLPVRARGLFLIVKVQQSLVGFLSRWETPTWPLL